MVVTRASDVMEIGTVYGPPPTRNSVPGAVTTTCATPAAVLVDVSAGGCAAAGGVWAGVSGAGGVSAGGVAGAGWAGGCCVGGCCGNGTTPGAGNVPGSGPGAVPG